MQLAKAITEGIEHKGFSFIEVLSQCPVQAGKNVWGEKEPSKIMEKYKECTYLYKPGSNDPTGAMAEKNADGKIPIGLFQNDKNAKEYLERVEEKLAACGINR